MKKLVLIFILGVMPLAAASLVVFRSISAKEASSASSGQETEVSPKSAKSLQKKIDTVKKANEAPEQPRKGSRVELSEAELESYVLYSLKEDIPVQIDSMKVQLAPGTIASDTQLTFTSNSTGNPMVDSFLGGTHNVFIKGKLAGEGGRGKFDLQEVRVDGIPVPKILIETLIDKYVKPKYPQADLKEPFELPWGIEEIKIEQGKATVVY
ncbi:MAG TPA: hypothetical protein VE422_46275 [Terriglobia bacterium]|nr:hypothetical protein [Terriglobia bacterium]